LHEHLGCVVHPKAHRLSADTHDAGVAAADHFDDSTVAKPDFAKPVDELGVA
jgi:hypothetical protein